jgi:hypothetical protein
MPLFQSGAGQGAASVGRIAEAAAVIGEDHGIRPEQPKQLAKQRHWGHPQARERGMRHEGHARVVAHERVEI